MAIKVPYTHGYYRVLNVFAYLTYFAWAFILFAAISVIPEFFHFAGFNPASLADTLPYVADPLPNIGWWFWMIPIQLAVGGMVGWLSLFALAAYFNSLTTGRWIHTLSTWLYIRITLKTSVSFIEAANLMWLFVPNETGEWHPIREVAAVSKEQRRTALFARAEQIADARWPQGYPPAGWYQDPENPGRQRYWDGYAWAAPAGPFRNSPRSFSVRAKRLISRGRPNLVYWAAALPFLLLALSAIVPGDSGSQLSIEDDPRRVIAEFKYQGLHEVQARSLTEALRSLGVDSISMVNVIDVKEHPLGTARVQIEIENGDATDDYYFATLHGGEVSRIWRYDPTSAGKELTLFSEGKPTP